MLMEPNGKYTKAVADELSKRTGINPENILDALGLVQIPHLERLRTLLLGSTNIGQACVVYAASAPWSEIEAMAIRKAADFLIAEAFRKEPPQ